MLVLNCVLKRTTNLNIHEVVRDWVNYIDVIIGGIIDFVINDPYNLEEEDTSIKIRKTLGKLNYEDDQVERMDIVIISEVKILLKGEAIIHNYLENHIVS